MNKKLIALSAVFAFISFTASAGGIGILDVEKIVK